jgi:hypothetical protein
MPPTSSTAGPTETYAQPSAADGNMQLNLGDKPLLRIATR